MAGNSANKVKTEKKRPAPPHAFKPGQSGNPSGRPKIPEEFKEMARANSVKALRKAITMMDDPEVPAAVQLKAAEVVMERAWGKANQPLTGLDDGPIAFDMEIQRLDDDELLDAITRTAKEIKDLQKRITAKD